MHLVIFGATGKTGIYLVRGALERGHRVTAFVRDPSKLEITDEHLLTVIGDVRDPAPVRKAVAGADAVVSALGHTPNSPPDLLRTAVLHMIRSMQEENVERLVYLTGAGVTTPKDPSSLTAKVMIPLLKLFAGQVLEDAKAAADLIEDSGLDWTIVRAPRLGDQPARGDYRSGYLSPSPQPVSRVDMADFMLDVVENDRYIREAPMVSY